MRGVLIFILATVLLLFGPEEIFAADNLLSNPDFENFSGSVPDSWAKYVSTLTTTLITDNDQVHSGGKSVLFQSSSNSTKYLYQVVSVNPGTSYHLSGWGKVLSGSGSEYLRVSQCSDTVCDSSKSEISSSDSTHALESSWKNFTVDFTAAGNAQAVKIKVSLDPTSSSEVSAIWDDLTLIQSTNITVTPPPGSSPTLTSTATQASGGPIFDFSLPKDLTVGSQFNMAIRITGLPAATYYMKVRIGPDLGHLTQGQTYNNAWLNDNDSWSKFGQITPDGSGNWQGNVIAQLPNGESSGSYAIQIRVKKTTTETDYVSDLKNISFKAGGLTGSSGGQVSGTNNSSGSKTISRVVPTTNAISLAGTNILATGGPDFNAILGIGTVSSKERTKIASEGGLRAEKPMVEGESRRILDNNLLAVLATGGGIVLLGGSGFIFWRSKGQKV